MSDPVVQTEACVASECVIIGAVAELNRDHVDRFYPNLLLIAKADCSNGNRCINTAITNWGRIDVLRLEVWSIDSTVSDHIDLETDIF
jgi:hypothetical protein